MLLQVAAHVALVGGYRVDDAQGLQLADRFVVFDQSAIDFAEERTALLVGGRAGSGVQRGLGFKHVQLFAGGDRIESVERRFERRNARRLIDLDCPSTVSKATAAQSQPNIHKPLARQVADQRWAGTRWGVRVDDDDAVIVVDHHLEPTLAHRCIPLICKRIEIQVATGGFVLFAQCLRFGHAEAVECAGQAQVTMTQGPADVHRALMLGGYLAVGNIGLLICAECCLGHRRLIYRLEGG